MKTSNSNKPTIPLLLGIASAFLVFTASSASAQDDVAALEDGKWLYERSCAGCHGVDGQGVSAFGNSLRDSDFAASAPAEVIVSLIQNGRYNRDRIYPDLPGMPAFDYIRGLEARALANYVRGALQNEGE